MQCASDLVKVRDDVISRIRSLREVVRPVSRPLGSAERRALSFATIEIDNLIIGGLRQFTKSSLLGGRTSSGIRVTSTVSPANPEEAAAFIFSSLNPQGYKKRRSPRAIAERDEIPVRDPKQFERVFLDFGLSNLPQFALALSLNATVFTEAKVCRHFFAHRARNTSEAVGDLALRLGIIRFETPEDLLLYGRPNTGVVLIEGWLADVENFFDLAA